MSPRRIVFLIIIVIALGYFIYAARSILFSPSLNIFIPRDGDAFESSLVRFAGRTDPGQRVLIQGKEFFADEAGYFEGTLVLFPGYTEIGFSAKDRFGNERRTTRKVFVKGD